MLVSATWIPDGVCTDNLIYAVLLPLSNYPPALSFCSSKYPVNPTTTTTTTTSTQVLPTTSVSVFVTVTVSTTTSTVTATATPMKMRRDLDGGLFLQLQGLVAGLVSTACSCIETPPVSVVSFSLEPFPPSH